jgi:hypothetical protein
MFRAMLFTQWKWSRAVLIPLVIATFAVPVYSVHQFSDASLSRWQVSSMLASMQAWGLGYMFVSVFVGLIIASATWSFDIKLKHVYALSLPLPRWHYLILRYAAGAVLLLIPAFFLWIGGLVATASSTIPIGLHPYPTALALRFLLATFISYSVIFAASTVPKKIAIVIAIVVGALILTDAAIDYFSGNSILISGLFDWAVRWPGFLEVFAGRWMLIDV